MDSYGKNVCQEEKCAGKKEKLIAGVEFVYEMAIGDAEDAKEKALKEIRRTYRVEKDLAKMIAGVDFVYEMAIGDAEDAKEKALKEIRRTYEVEKAQEVKDAKKTQEMNAEEKEMTEKFYYEFQSAFEKVYAKENGRDYSALQAAYENANSEEAKAKASEDIRRAHEEEDKEDDDDEKPYPELEQKILDIVGAWMLKLNSCEHYTPTTGRTIGQILSMMNLQLSCVESKKLAGYYNGIYAFSWF